MTITINGEQYSLPEPLTVDQLLAKQGFGKGIAVAINGIFVPRATFARQVVKGGDAIEILAPMQGG